MALTYELIQKVTVGSTPTATITLSSIPQTFDDLVLITSLRENSGESFSNDQIRFNSDSGNNYNRYSIRYTGASRDGSLNSGLSYLVFQYQNGGTATANAFGSAELYIPNYRAAKMKVMGYHAVNETNATSGIYQTLTGGQWNNTAAITSITVTELNSDSYVQYSTLYLYGIKNTV